MEVKGGVCEDERSATAALSACCVSVGVIAFKIDDGTWCL